MSPPPRSGYHAAVVGGIPLAAWLFGCGPRLLEEDLGGLRHLWGTFDSSRSGTARVDLPIEPGETAMLATARVDPPFQVHVRNLYDPGGTSVFSAFEWTGSEFSKSNAAFVADTVSLNWPIVSVDPALVAEDWELEFGVVDANQAYTSRPVTLDVLLKRDADLEHGALSVSIVYVGGLDGDEDLRAAVTDSKPIWTDLYASIGIEVTFAEFVYDTDGLGPPAFGGEPAYVDIAEQTPENTVNLVISEVIEGAGFEQIFGIAGDIPGPLLPTTRSAVQISRSLSAGVDGQFDEEDTRLLAETMAHEVLHFLGLFHPVEATWDAWDVLGDTPECASENECVDGMADNLMFPFPVCGLSCIPQEALTAEQGSVANRYVGVD
jgi:hypothetical protein